MRLQDSSSFATPPRASDFGFEFAKADGGWKWTAYDGLGRVRASGVAPTRAIAAACVIRELSRT